MFGVELHPVATIARAKEVHSIGWMSLVTCEKVDIADLLCPKGVRSGTPATAVCVREWLTKYPGPSVSC